MTKTRLLKDDLHFHGFLPLLSLFHPSLKASRATVKSRKCWKKAFSPDITMNWLEPPSRKPPFAELQYKERAQITPGKPQRTFCQKIRYSKISFSCQFHSADAHHHHLEMFWMHFLASNWKLPAYNEVSKLTVVFGNFFVYNWCFSTYSWSFVAHSGAVFLISTSTDCKQKAQLQAKKLQL